MEWIPSDSIAELPVAIAAPNFAIAIQQIGDHRGIYDDRLFGR
jgi:hypothetical protein